MLIAVSCSKEKQTMNNGLVIEDIKIGDGQEVEKFNIVKNRKIKTHTVFG